MVPWKKFSEIWCLGKKVPGKMVPGKKNLRKSGPRKNGLRRNGPQKSGFQKNGHRKNLNDFFYFYRFHCTHKKMFEIHLTILHAPNCRTLKECRKVCCRVLGFHILITSQHSTHTHTHTPRCSTLTSRFFVSESWVCCRVLSFYRLITDPQTTGARIQENCNVLKLLYFYVNVT